MDADKRYFLSNVVFIEERQKAANEDFVSWLSEYPEMNISSTGVLNLPTEEQNGFWSSDPSNPTTPNALSTLFLPPLRTQQQPPENHHSSFIVHTSLRAHEIQGEGRAF